MVKELLLSSNYWVLSKPIVKEFGLEAAFLLSNLAEAESMMSDEEGWFYQTSSTIEEITGLSNHKQTTAINQLIECGALERKNVGVPMKRYFKINYETIQKLVFKNFENCNSKNLKTNIEKISNNKESINKKNIDKETNKTSSAEIENFFDECWEMYPSKLGKGSIKDKAKKETYKLGEEFKRCIKRYIEFVEQKRKKDFKDLKWKNGSTFWNSGYIDFLDENYKNINTEKTREQLNKESEEKYGF